MRRSVLITKAGQPEGSEVQPSWDNTFSNLPDAVVGVPYSVNLTDYGVDIDEVHEIASSINYSGSEGIWPDGLTLNTGTGVLSGTPTTDSEVAVVNVVGVNGSFNASSDWSYRTGLSNIKITEDFPDNASVRDISDNLSGRQAASQWDNSVKLFGNGSLRQEMLDTDYYQVSANWRKEIIGGTYLNPTELQIGEQIWICYSMLYNRASCNWDVSTTSGGNWPKIAIIDRTGTSTGREVVNQGGDGIYRGYNRTTPSEQWQTSLSTNCSASDFVFQPEIDNGADPLSGTNPGLSASSGSEGAWNACQQDRARYGGLYTYDNLGSLDGRPDPLTGGGIMNFGWWQSQLCHITRNTSLNVTVEWYWAPLGMDWELMYSETFDTSAGTGGNYGVVNFTNSFTNAEAEEGVRPTLNRWYDGLITRMGSAGIPAPGFTTSSVIST